MKNRSSCLLATGLLWLSASSLSVAATDNDIFEQLEQDCQQTIEVNYQSQHLQLPQQELSVYFDVILRRIGQPDNDNPEYCPPIGFQTPTLTMVVETPTGQRNIGLQPENFAYVFVKPVSFSPEGRYLVIQKDYGYSGGDGGSALTVIDLQDDFRAVPVAMCQHPDRGYQADFLEAQGFISATQMLVTCEEIYGASEEWTEIVDLSQATAELVSLRPTYSQKYGNWISPQRILQRQVFPIPR